MNTDIAMYDRHRQTTTLAFLTYFRCDELLGWQLSEGQTLFCALLDEAWIRWVRNDERTALRYIAVWTGTVEIVPGNYLVRLGIPDEGAQ